MPQFTRRIGLLWNCLLRVKSCWAGGLKLGYFSSAYPRLHFLCKFANFLSIQGILSLFKVQKHSIHQFWGLKLPGEQYPLSTLCGSRQSNSFSTQLDDFDCFTAEKHPNLVNWAHKLLEKNWVLRSPMPRVKNPILPRFGALEFWQHWSVCSLLVNVYSNAMQWLYSLWRALLFFTFLRWPI